MRSVIHILVLCTLGLLSATASAQEISFKATVDRNAIAVGGSLKLTLTLTNGSGSMTPPDLGGLSVVQGPFESTGFNIVNGRMTSSISRTYILTATKEGQYTIGSAVARVGGGVIQTDPIVITVAPGQSSTNDPAAQRGQGQNRDLFATISLSRNKAYVGQQVVLTYSIYSRYSNLELAEVDIPSLTGAWIEEVDIGETHWEDQLRTINGLQYRVAVLKKQVIFPQKSGSLTVGPARIGCLVNRTFFNRGSRVDVSSNAETITVMAHPGTRPADFTGAVGDLKLEVTATPLSLQANEAIDLKVRVSGTGNLKLLEAPRIDFPGDFETYDPKVIDKISVNGNGMSGSREFQYTVIARHAGSYPLQPVTLTYFDVGAGAYRTLTSEVLVFDVAKGDGTTAGGNTYIAPGRRDLEVLDRDIRYIRTGDLGLRPKGSALFGSWSYMAGMAAPVLAFVLLFAWRRTAEQGAADVVGRRRKAAEKVARKRLKEANEALTANAREPFYTALSKALDGYLMDKFGLAITQVTPAEVLAKLPAAPATQEPVERFFALKASCELARFAPVEDRSRQEVYNEAVELIGRIEELAHA